MRCRPPRFVSALLLGCALGAGAARAHEFALDSVMNAFVVVTPNEAHLVIRVPLHLMARVRMPTNGRELDLANIGPASARALAALARDITLEEEGRPLVPSRALGRPSLPSDRSFEQYESAVAHVAEPVASGTGIYYDQGYFDAHLIYPIAAADSALTIRTTVAPELKDYVKLSIRYLTPGAEGRAMMITRSSGAVALNPGWASAATSFVAMGIAHILTGADHLLFLLCLLIPLYRWREIVVIVTAFTVAHSVTLIGATFDLAPRGAWFPALVETTIAASIVFVAIENIVGVDLRRRLVLTGLFGLIHGFGFAYGLREDLQFAGNHLLVALVSFNVGIELGQLVVLAAMLPMLALLRRYLFAGRIGIIVLSAIVAHTAWHWMIDRGELLSKVEWPRPDIAALAMLATWIGIVLLAAAAIGHVARRLRFAQAPRMDMRRAFTRRA